MKITSDADFYRRAWPQPAETSVHRWEREKHNLPTGDNLDIPPLAEKALWTEGLTLTQPFDGLHGPHYEIIRDHDSLDAAAFYKHLGVRTLGIGRDTYSAIYATEDHRIIIRNLESSICTWYDTPFWDYVTSNGMEGPVNSWNFELTFEYELSDIKDQQPYVLDHEILLPYKPRKNIHAPTQLHVTPRHVTNNLPELPPTPTTTGTYYRGVRTVYVNPDYADQTFTHRDIYETLTQTTLTPYAVGLEQQAIYHLGGDGSIWMTWYSRLTQIAHVAKFHDTDPIQVARLSSQNPLVRVTYSAWKQSWEDEVTRGPITWGA